MPIRIDVFLLAVLAAIALPIAASKSWQDVARERLAKYDYGNTAPLIGILSQPCHDCPGSSYIPAAYVKWVESAGGRVVPIRYDDSDARLEMLFKMTNGLLLPGGLTYLYLDAPYVITARKLYNMITKANDDGNVYPIHGTCLGHQLLHVLLTNASRDVVLVETDSVQNPNILNFTHQAANSLYFGNMNSELFQRAADPAYNIAYENHEMGVPPHHYQEWPELDEWYNIVSTTKDRNGQEYVSTVEGKKYPFFGTQWHPEKPPFEFSDNHIPHIRDAIAMSNHLANSFIDIARLGRHKVDMELELQHTIYNYAPAYTARDDVFEGSYDGPDMCYFLPASPDPAVFPPPAEDARR